MMKFINLYIKKLPTTIFPEYGIIIENKEKICAVIRLAHGYNKKIKIICDFLIFIIFYFVGSLRQFLLTQNFCIKKLFSINNGHY